MTEFEDDVEALDVLAAEGFFDVIGVFFLSDEDWYRMSNKAKEAVIYLCYEWDYASNYPSKTVLTP